MVQYSIFNMKIAIFCVNTSFSKPDGIHLNKLGDRLKTLKFFLPIHMAPGSIFHQGRLEVSWPLPRTWPHQWCVELGQPPSMQHARRCMQQLIAPVQRLPWAQCLLWMCFLPVLWLCTQQRMRQLQFRVGSNEGTKGHWSRRRSKSRPRFR